MTFREVVEAALAVVFNPDPITGTHCPECDNWHRIYDWYEARYLNPDSPERRRP